MPGFDEEGEKLVLLPEAPPLVPDHELDDMPVLLTTPDGRCVGCTYAEAVEWIAGIEQNLARMMRRRGTSTPPPPEIGGTPAAMPMKMAA